MHAFLGRIVDFGGQKTLSECFSFKMKYLDRAIAQNWVVGRERGRFE